MRAVRTALCLALAAAMLVPARPASLEGTSARVEALPATGVAPPRLDLVTAQRASAAATPEPDRVSALSVVEPASTKVARPDPVRGTGATASTRAAVRASWFGPGLWGKRTACGLTLTSALRGVAHRTLPCGSSVTLTYGSATVTVPVVDRGPFIASREFDLTYATRVALACPDICRLLWLR